MAKYDINDPYELDMMNAQFDLISEDEWDEYIELAIEKKLPYKNIGALRSARKKAGISKYLSAKMVRWAMSIVDELDQLTQNDERDDAAQEQLNDNNQNIPLSHLTLRVAWHDNKWNGNICNDPENNNYCNGYHSLLSDRIRRRKDENLSNEVKYKGVPLKEIDYVPPCFWSVNLFGEEEIQVKHDNPAAPTLHNIEESVPPKSVLSWPFAVSFTRSKKEVHESGAYPKNLETVRIPRFNAKMKQGKSIAFMYANYSNPLTEEEQKYLVIGAGIVENKQEANEIPHFKPQSEIDKIRADERRNERSRNFPSMNWAMQFGFEDYSMVRMPYHEYLEEFQNVDIEAKDTFFDKIKVAITEPELEWCFKYVAMDIGDDEAIYILSKMRKALVSCLHDNIVPVASMQERIDKVDGLLEMAWEQRSYFPGFTSISRMLLNKVDEVSFPLESFYDEFKEETEHADVELQKIFDNPYSNPTSKPFASEIGDLVDKLEQWGFTTKQFLQLSLLNLKPFQFERILTGKLKLMVDWIRDFNDDVKPSHRRNDIMDNPYLLYEDYDYWPDSHDDVYGEERDSPIDLFKIDIAFYPNTAYLKRLALQREMKFTDKRRMRALVVRHLKTLENTGDCFSSSDHLQEVMRNYPLFYEIGLDYQIPSNFFHPLSSDYVIHFEDDRNKLILVEANEKTYYYLSEVNNAEKNIESIVKQLLNATKNKDEYPGLQTSIENALTSDALKGTITEEKDKRLFREERTNLYTNLFKEKLFILAGSAGSGKSFEILNILTYLENQGQKYLLLAPTGKAAQRLSSDPKFKNIEASTIDKFLSDVKYKKISHASILQYKNVVIDEMSMVDLLKFDRLLKVFNFKEPSFKRLILIGDPNQLPAIGYGRILADIISFLKQSKEFANAFIQLESNCRSQLKENEVLSLADSFKQGNKDPLPQELEKKLNQKEREISKGFIARYWRKKEELQNQLVEEFEKLPARNYASLNEKLNDLLGISASGSTLNDISKIDNFQILTPYHGQFSGAGRINDFIQSQFKKGIPLELRKNTFKQGDKLIRTKNYYQDKELLLSNGTLGVIQKKSKEKFIFDGKEGEQAIDFYDIRKADQEFFELAYAITVHKSQGSGFNHLFIVIPERYGLLSKELIYTALTRTKETVTLFLQEQEENRNSVLEYAMQKSFSSQRQTSLMLDKPYQHYDLEPEKGVFVESRIELLIYHILMNKRKELEEVNFKFDYEVKPVVNGKEVNIKTDFTVYCNNKTWYWEHLGLIGQHKYTRTWKELKKPTYQKAGIWDNVITTDETCGINVDKIEALVQIILDDNVSTEDKHNTYSNHHYYLR